YSDQTEHIGGNSFGNFFMNPVEEIPDDMSLQSFFIPNRESYVVQFSVGGEADIVKINFVETTGKNIFSDGNIVIPNFRRSGVHPHQAFIVLPGFSGR